MEENQFLALISANQGIIYKICQLYRDTDADREDLFQEIVFQLWRSIDSFRGDAKPSTFIYRIALNTAITAFKKGKRAIVSYTDQLPEIAMEAEQTALVQRKENLFAAIRKLEEADRALIALWLDELSYREIGEIIGISENNVAVRISRIKNKIKTTLTT